MALGALAALLATACSVALLACGAWLIAPQKSAVLETQPKNFSTL